MRVFPVAADVSSAVEPSVPPGGRVLVPFNRSHDQGSYPGGRMPPSTAGETPAATRVGAKRGASSALLISLALIIFGNNTYSQPAHVEVVFSERLGDLNIDHMALG